MSGSFESNPADGQQSYVTPDSAAANESASNAIDRVALEKALQETFDAASAGAPIDPSEMKAIREAAAKHKSETITLDIAADLIAAVLTTHYRALRASESFWQTVARDIARTLCDDPHTEARLSTLWQRLRKEST